MTPRRDGRLVVTGRVGETVSIDAARDAARLAARNALAAVVEACGGLEKLDCLVQLTVYVACGATFVEHSKVADGASAALSETLGERADVARVAVGVSSLPGGAPVEVQLVALCRP